MNDNDQLVIYQLLAAAAQIGIILAAGFAVKGFFGALDRLGVIANRAGKGIYDRARNKGQDIKGNTAYQRGKAERKNAKQARKTADYASRMDPANDPQGKNVKAFLKRRRAGLTRGASRGVVGNVPGAGRVFKGNAKDASVAARRAREIARKEEIEATSRARSDMTEAGMFSQDPRVDRRDAHNNRLGVREAMTALARGEQVTVTDASGHRRAFNAGADATLRYGAMAQATAVGDATAVDRMLNGRTDPATGRQIEAPVEDAHQPALAEFVQANASSLMTKMPHLYKGEAGAFGNPSAGNVAGWHERAAVAARQYATTNPQARANIERSFREVLGNDQVFAAMDPGAVRELGQEFGITDINAERQRIAANRAAGIGAGGAGAPGAPGGAGGGNVLFVPHGGGAGAAQAAAAVPAPPANPPGGGAPPTPAAPPPGGGAPVPPPNPAGGGTPATPPPAGGTPATPPPAGGTPPNPGPQPFQQQRGAGGNFNNGPGTTPPAPPPSGP